MCGIAGFVGRFPDGLLARMSERIAARGPDDHGSIVLRPRSGPPVALAHRRLSIIDLSPDGHQPMEVCCSRCGPQRTGRRAGRLWLVYNGELYNYRELREELEARGHRFTSQSDTEVLLHLYAEEGPAMLERLNGIFAFALYDGRKSGQADGVESGDLLLARDGFGVKPLYLAETGQGLLFASELKALLAWDELPVDLDPVAIHHYLTYLWCPAPRTPLRSVSKLEPGEALIVRGGRVARRWTFYDVPYRGDPIDGSYDELARMAAERIEQAVGRQLVADVEVGAFLSGGLDSSAITALMRKLRPDSRIACYSIGFRDDGSLGGHSPDLPYARQVAEHFGLDLRVIEVGPEIIDHLEELIYILDEPQADPAPINSLLIARQARADGLKVLMSGQGADDIFTGYRRHRAVALERYWDWIPRRLRRGIAGPARRVYDGRGRLPGADGQRFRQAARALSSADLDGDARLISYFRWGGERLRRSLYAPPLARELEGVDSGEPLLRSLARIPDEPDPVNRMLYLETRHFLPDHNLNYTDKTGMAAGVEARVPYLDPDLVELATRLPSAAKMRGGRPKALMRHALEGVLPDSVIHRPKTGFGAPLRRWLKRELRPQVEELLSPAVLESRGLFDPAAVRRLVELDRGRRVDGAYTIFSLMCIELWCRAFVDRRGEPVSPAA